MYQHCSFAVMLPVISLCPFQNLTVIWDSMSCSTHHILWSILLVFSCWWDRLQFWSSEVWSSLLKSRGRQSYVLKALVKISFLSRYRDYYIFVLWPFTPSLEPAIQQYNTFFFCLEYMCAFIRQRGCLKMMKQEEWVDPSAGPATLHRLVRELIQVVPAHVGLELHLVEGLVEYL
jgi:hypothetical protein